MITINDINSAYDRIKSTIHRTPILSSQLIDSFCDTNIFFKCENFQKVGAFKFRGVSNAVSLIDKGKLKYGVATHSSGNHGQAVALAAKLLNIPAYIVMPNNSPIAKINAISDYGGNITFCTPTLAAREEILDDVITNTKANFIHPYNDMNVIAGQGTATIEILNEINDIEVIIVPVGGGGLLSGTSIVAKSINSNIKVFGAEPTGADDAYRSLRSGYVQINEITNTICDGLRTSLGNNTFEIISKYVDDILLVEDEWTIKAMRLIWERMKIVVEPSASITLGAIMKYREMFKKKRLGVILTGGNLDLTKLPF